MATRWKRPPHNYISRDTGPRHPQSWQYALRGCTYVSKSTIKRFQPPDFDQVWGLCDTGQLRFVFQLSTGSNALFPRCRCPGHIFTSFIVLNWLQRIPWSKQGKNVRMLSSSHPPEQAKALHFYALLYLCKYTSYNKKQTQRVTKPTDKAQTLMPPLQHTMTQQNHLAHHFNNLMCVHMIIKTTLMMKILKNLYNTEIYLGNIVHINHIQAHESGHWQQTVTELSFIS